MAKLETRPMPELTFRLVISESEARALDALAGYGIDEFLKCFYTHMGKAYLEPHEDGLRSLLGASSALAGFLERKEDADKVFSGQCVIARPQKD